ncbi:hypothetical protein FXO37_02413 [Capsicum annuum]|nr:hypothetical protein FXO37_02413 [Capsicum annuum]
MSSNLFLRRLLTWITWFTFAVGAFTMLNYLGADYDRFYRDVKDLISKKYDLHTEERKGDMLSLSELERKYEERSLKSDEEKHKADLASAQAEVEKLGTQVEAAKTMKEEHEQRKNAALQEIESISRRLLDQ